jgi:hypothetical protein
MKRINHEEAYSLNGVHELGRGIFSAVYAARKSGHHHHLAGAYLLRYAQEASWREDNRVPQMASK